jgi:hypothetical protein
MGVFLNIIVLVTSIVFMGYSSAIINYANRSLDDNQTNNLTPKEYNSIHNFSVFVLICSIVLVLVSGGMLYFAFRPKIASAAV